jgi:hypothetical protein
VIVEKDNERYDESRGALVVRAWEYAGRAGTVCERANIIFIYLHIFFFFFFFGDDVVYTSIYASWMGGIMREAKSW